MICTIRFDVDRVCCHQPSLSRLCDTGSSIEPFDPFVDMQILNRTVSGRFLKVSISEMCLCTAASSAPAGPDGWY